MIRYAEWTPTTPLQHSLENTSLLLRISALPIQWDISSLPQILQRVIIDSDNIKDPTRKLLERQRQISSGIDVPCLFTPPHYPIYAEADYVTVDRKLSLNLAKAYELKSLTNSQPLASNCKLMAVVHGNSTGSLHYCANELKAVGFDCWALGSIAKLTDPIDISMRFHVVYKVIQQPLHIFDIDNLDLLADIDHNLIASISPPASRL
jgi:queuine/archaeosine tRNA-ribosyltransferase